MGSLLEVARELAAVPRPDVFRVSAFVDLDPSVVPTDAALDVALRGTLLHGGDARLLDADLLGDTVAALLRFPRPTR